MSKLRDSFGSDRIWVNWKFESVKGKMTKVPYSPVTGAKASSTNEATWATYDEAKRASPDIGIMFTPAEDILGIDIDHCINKETNNIEHEQKEIIADLILEADTYTEISPSGTGLHLLFAIEGGSLKLSKNRHSPYEAYTSGRYFTVTERPYGKEEKEVRTISIDEALHILSIIGYPWAKEAPLVSAEQGLSTKETRVPVSLPDEKLLRKMFASKNGEAIKKLYDGDMSAHDNNGSQADMSLCSHLAFWAGRDFGQIERLWLASPLGAREKTQKRQDYRTRTINAAIAACKEVYSIPKEAADAMAAMADPELDLIYTVNDKKEKVYVQNTENICRVLRKHEDFKDMLHYDVFKVQYEIKTPSGKWRGIEDNDMVDIQTAISIIFPCFSRVGKEMVKDAVKKVAKEHAIDSAKDAITSVKWDGKKRLDDWLAIVFGSPDDEYHRAVASNWIKGMIKRAIEPGCKFDYVLVVEGPQGSGKSSVFDALGGEWYVETTMGTDTKDFFMQMLGKLLIEFSEGETMSRTEVKRMKGIISTRVDRFRPPYESTSQDFPRRCVFAMTTNQEQYLKDETGNRRYLPVKNLKAKADVQWVIDNRFQMFAEAYHRLTVLKETIYEFPAEATEAEQEKRQIEDPNTDNVIEWYHNKILDKDRENGVTTSQIYRDVFGGIYSNRPIDRLHEMIISNILRSQLGLIRVRKSVSGTQLWRWVSAGPQPKEKKVVGQKALPSDTITAKDMIETVNW